MKERHDRYHAFENKEESLLDPPPSVRIEDRLEEFESGAADSFWRLNFELSLKPTSTHYMSWIDPDLTTLPGWESANDITRARIIAAATRYLADGEPKDNAWLGSGSISYAAMAGYRALRLLLKFDGARLESMPPAVWERCAPIVLTFPLNRRKDEDRELVALTYQRAPAAFTEALKLLVLAENAKNGTIYVLSRSDGIWDLSLENALLDLLGCELTVSSLGAILEVLLEHGSPKAMQIARSWVETRVSGADRARAVVAATKLVKFVAHAAWDVLWPAVQDDAAFGIEVFSGATSGIGNRDAQSVKRLSEAQLGDLFVWLARNVPYDGDIQVNGAVGSREFLQRWRGGILDRLKELGTAAACDQIRRFIDEFPQLGWLKYPLLEAEASARTKSWVPLSTQEILRIIGDPQARLVRNGQHLAVVLIESLKRLEAQLQGETPAAIDLWDEIKKTVFRPKDENRFSDYIKRHLERDVKDRGIIASREVEIRRGTGGSPGERTDIHVDAIASGLTGGGFDTATVVIEVKGSWNPGLLGDMKGQLVDRYLKDNPCRHGLYVVGWFNCAQWDDTDSRRGLPPHFSIDLLKERLNAQAVELSLGGLFIRAEVLNAALR